MREKVIIYDGKKSHEIGAEYFFQHDFIKDLKKTDVNKLYESTSIYLNNLCKDQTEEVYQVQRGLKILEQMVLDLNGNEEGRKIIGIINLLYL